MTDAITTLGTTTEGGAAPKTEVTPPAAGAAAGTAAKTEVTPPATAGKPAASAEIKRQRLDGGEGAIPDDADLLEMSPRALKSRLDRYSSKQLKDLFGTDDVEAIKKDFGELREHRENKEKERQAQLSEVERERELRIAAEGRERVARNQAREAHEQRVFERDDAKLSGIAGKYIDEDYVDSELGAFARHLLREFSPKQLRKMTDKQRDSVADDFFKGRIEKKPKLAKDFDERKSAELREQIKKENRAAGKAPVNNSSGGHGRKPGETAERDDSDKPLGQRSYAEIKKAGFSYR
jgi:hypothetical protein